MPDVDENELVDRGGIPPTEFHNSIERLSEIADYDLEVPSDLDARLDREIEGLIIPNEVIRSVAAALRVGHIVIQGPPGTGKSSLVRAIARAFNVTTFPVTAHEDWTIYDVIGRLELRLTADRCEEIVPVNGAFTEAVIRCGNNMVRHFDDPLHPQAEWLLIDELNRAHLDKAFGELFSVLGTDDLVPINLPHQLDGNRKLVIPRRFRIVATLNSYDKQFVQSLSQAIRRRFTFVSLDVPPQRPTGHAWTYDTSHPVPAIREFSIVISRAAQRVAKRICSADPDRAVAKTAELVQSLTTEHHGRVSALFELAESVRYAREGGDKPYLPLGTAQVLDTVELFLTRHLQDAIHNSDANEQMDWAAAVKLATLFESDVVSPEQLTAFARGLPPIFAKQFGRELLKIAASGMHFVPDA